MATEKGATARKVRKKAMRKRGRALAAAVLSVCLAFTSTVAWAQYASASSAVETASSAASSQPAREGAAVGGGELAALAESASTRRRNVGRVLAALDWADPRSENGGESIARGRMLLLGFVRPELQVEVPRVVEEGRPYRADYCWIRADGLVILGELDGTIKYLEEEFMGGRDIGEVLSDENVRGSRFTLYDVSLVRFGFGVTDSPVQFARILDDYGVPRRGTPLALPDGTPMIPDWESLRRNRR